MQPRESNAKNLSATRKLPAGVVHLAAIALLFAIALFATACAPHGTDATRGHSTVTLVDTVLKVDTVSQPVTRTAARHHTVTATSHR